MKTVVIKNDDVFDFKITYHEDLEHNPDQIDLTWMLIDYSQYLYATTNETRFEALFYIFVNQ